MKRVQLDDQLVALFGNFEEDVALCDTAGNIVATIKRSTPWSDPDQWETLTPEMSAEEWQRLSQSKERGVSTQEMLRELREQS